MYVDFAFILSEFEPVFQSDPFRATSLVWDEKMRATGRVTPPLWVAFLLGNVRFGT